MRAHRSFPLLAALVALASVSSCVGRDAPTGPGGGGTAFLALQSVSWQAEGVERDINRIRVEVTRVPGGARLTDEALDVDPTAQGWDVPIELTLPADGPIQVMLLILLVHRDGSVESVEWSGRVGPITVIPGQTTLVPHVDFVRGPPGNLSVTSVVVLPDPPPVLAQGGTFQLEAVVGTNDPGAQTVVFWTSLEPEIVSVDGDGGVLGLAPGTGRIVARAGAFADTASVTVVERVDLQVDKQVSHPEANEGDVVTFEVTVHNAGPSAATGVQIADALPAGLSLVSSTPSVGQYDGGVWDVGALSAGAEASLAITAAVEPGTAGQTLTNTASVAAVEQPDSIPENDVASASVEVTAVDVAVSKSADPGAASLGQEVTFTVSVTNHGPDAATGVVVSDTLPEGLVLQSADPSAGAYVDGLWTVGALAPGAEATLTLSTVTGAGTAGLTLTNTARLLAVDQADTDPSNDVASADVVVQGLDLEVTKEVDRSPAVEGGIVTFTVVVRNLGPTPATEVRISDPLPDGLGFSSATTNRGSYAPATGVWDVGALPVGTTGTLTLRALIGDGRAGQTLVNTASVESVVPGDANPVNDTASAEVAVIPRQTRGNFGSVGNTELVAGSFPRPARPHVYRAAGVLAGAPGDVTVTSTGTFSSEMGGTVTMQADGGFSYVPPAGLATADAFDYTLSNGATGGADVVHSGMIWYVDNRAGRELGSGTSTDPFGDLVLAVFEAGQAGRIYVRAGDGSTDGHDFTVELQDGQMLEGEGVALVAGADELFAAGTPPRLTSFGSEAVRLGNGNTVRGILIDFPETEGILGDDVSGGTLEQIEISGGGTGISLVNVTGPFTITDVTIGSTGGPGVSLDNAEGVTLSGVDIAFAGVGILGNDVVDLVVEESSLTGTNDVFGERGIDIEGLTGASAIRNTTVSEHFSGNARISVPSGTLSLDVTGSSFDSGGQDGFLMLTSGDGSATVVADGSSFDANDRSGFLGAGFGTSSLTLQLGGGTTFDGNGAWGFEVFDSAGVRIDLEVRNSLFRGNLVGGVSLTTQFETTSADGITGVIAGNTFTEDVGRGGALEFRGLGLAESVLVVTDNVVEVQSPSAEGATFVLGSGQGDGGRLDLTLDGNELLHGVNTSGNPLRVGVTGTGVLCLALGSNTVEVGSGQAGVQALNDVDASSTFEAEELVGTTDADMEDFILSRTSITVDGTAEEVIASGVFTPVAANGCREP